MSHLIVRKDKGKFKIFDKNKKSFRSKGTTDKKDVTDKAKALDAKEDKK